MDFRPAGRSGAGVEIGGEAGRRGRRNRRERRPLCRRCLRHRPHRGHDQRRGRAPRWSRRGPGGERRRPAGRDVRDHVVRPFADATELNLLSTVAMCHQVIPGMLERGWGRVVAITSLAVRQPMPQLILSNTARAGPTAFLKTTATEVAADGVTVNSVQPGIHLTERPA